MWNSFKNRLVSAVAAERPGIAEVELIVETFKRIYHENFSSEEMERICARIREYHRAIRNNDEAFEISRRPS
ncbi:MAG: hypothetical protein AAB354_16835 [candidate division KSB1 bacterium]